MIVCSECLHHNPDDSAYCESCGVSLPPSSSCSNCGAPVESKAHFCGQCGFNLLTPRPSFIDSKSTQVNELLIEPPPPEPVLFYERLKSSQDSPVLTPKADQASADLVSSRPIGSTGVKSEPENTSSTKIQPQSITLLHVQSNTAIDLKPYRSAIYVGKPNDRMPPDINVGVLPNAEVVSRVHAVIRRNGDQYSVEDLGSANGTYVNDAVLKSGTQYQLSTGDRICLGKGDLVTFVFQMG